VAPDPADAVMASLGGAEAARQIAAVLPPAHAEIVLLRVVGGFTAEEVAEITGKRPGAVRVIAHRALRKLAKEISPDL
jgi:RNA polymerase sigma-70 factor (ECF subfamily)